MWFSFPLGGRNERREQSRANRAAPGPMIEALGDRVLPSATAPSAPPTAAIVLPLAGSATLAQKQDLQVDGTFSVTNVHGSRLSATIDATMSLDDGAPLHFTIDAHVKLMGNHIEGTPTMVFDDGSTMSFYYEIQLDKDTGIFEGDFWISGGTGQFEGASGGGEIYYPVAQVGPIEMEGWLLL
jgi:hypothetical protein